MKASEYREMHPEELTSELDTLKQRFFEIRTQAVTEKLEDPTQLNKLRKDIARIKTVQREQELSRSADAD